MLARSVVTFLHRKTLKLRYVCCNPKSFFFREHKYELLDYFVQSVTILLSLGDLLLS